MKYSAFTKETSSAFILKCRRSGLIEDRYAYCVPECLVRDNEFRDLSFPSKMAMSVLLQKMAAGNLSADHEGTVYLRFSAELLAQEMRIPVVLAEKCLRELKRKGLILNDDWETGRIAVADISNLMMRKYGRTEETDYECQQV